MIRNASFLAILLALPLAGCLDVAEKPLGGDIEINGQKEVVVACRRGRNADGSWIEVSSSSGHRVRLQEKRSSGDSANGRTETAILVARPGDATPVEVSCLSKWTARSSSQGRVFGNANLRLCWGQGVRVSAKFDYSRCTEPGRSIGAKAGA